MEIFADKTLWDYKLLDSGNGQRLEQWGKFRLSRPDPQAIWNTHVPESEWQKADATFDRSWHIRTTMPKMWEVHFPLPLKRGQTHTGPWELTLAARLTPFKHTGIFAEQSANWNWLAEQVLNNPTHEQKKVLNLFGYTGAATVLLAKLGCFVTHVDASKPAIGWAKENQALNDLPEDSIRWILDDAFKFVKREVKRGAQYDGVVMDPPAFGHAPDGRTWKFAEDFPLLLSEVQKLLAPKNSFLLVNAYATNSSALALHNVVEDTFPSAGTLATGELCVSQADGRLLSTGIVARRTTI